MKKKMYNKDTKDEAVLTSPLPSLNIVHCYDSQLANIKWDMTWIYKVIGFAKNTLGCEEVSKHNWSNWQEM